MRLKKYKDIILKVCGRLNTFFNYLRYDFRLISSSFNISIDLVLL